MYGIMTITILLTGSPAVSVMQIVVSANMRAEVAAIYLLVSNLFGLGLEPLIIGMISDLLEPTYGVESIRCALRFIFIPILPSTLFNYIVGPTYKKKCMLNPSRNE